jgi:hypothetical protein
MTLEETRDAIEEALRRVGEHAESRIGAIRELWVGRWGAEVLDAVSGRRRTTIGFDAPEDTSRERVVELAGVELQVWLKLCGLCRRPSYVTREDAAARVIFFNCPHCGSYRIDGHELTLPTSARWSRAGMPRRCERCRS